MSELGKSEGGPSGALEEIHQLASEGADSMRGILWMIRDGKRPKSEQIGARVKDTSGTGFARKKESF